MDLWEASPLGEGFPPFGRREGSPPTGGGLGMDLWEASLRRSGFAGELA